MRLTSFIPRRIRRVGGEQSGLAAIQFAFIGPFLLLVYLGVVSIYDAVRGNQQMGKTAVTISDLVTRAIDLDDEKRDALFATADSLLSNWDKPSSYSISITSIVNPEESWGLKKKKIDQAVAWSQANEKGAELETKDLDNFEIPSIAEGESLILVVVSGEYAPRFSGWGVPARIEMTETSVRRPRFVSEVTYYDENGDPLDWVKDLLGGLSGGGSGGGGGGDGDDDDDDDDDDD